MLPDEDSRPQERNRNVDAVAERIQNFIEIVAIEIDVFGALRPEDRHFGAMVGDKEDVDVVRVAVVLATMVTVLILIIILVMVVTAALDNHGIGFDRLVSRLIARHARRGGLETG